MPSDNAAEGRVLIDPRDVSTWPHSMLWPFLYLTVIHALFWLWLLLEVTGQWHA